MTSERREQAPSKNRQHSRIRSPRQAGSSLNGLQAACYAHELAVGQPGAVNPHVGGRRGAPRGGASQQDHRSPKPRYVPAFTSAARAARDRVTAGAIGINTCPGQSLGSRGADSDGDRLHQPLAGMLDWSRCPRISRTLLRDCETRNAFAVRGSHESGPRSFRRVGHDIDLPRPAKACCVRRHP